MASMVVGILLIGLVCSTIMGPRKNSWKQFDLELLRKNGIIDENGDWVRK